MSELQHEVFQSIWAEDGLMGKCDQNRVEVLGSSDVAQVVPVLSESCRDYPVMRYVLGSSPEFQLCGGPIEGQIRDPAQRSRG